MKAEELRAIQAPLKQRYREDPETACIILKAQGRLGEGVTCNVQTGKALARAGLHPLSGGDGLALCSGDMLLEALVACAGVTLQSVATAMGIEIREGTVRAEGTLDFRGTMGVDRETPVGFQRIALSFELDTDEDDKRLAALLEKTERYCVVFQTLRHSPEMQVVARREADPTR
ncbi:MAG TPA: OsmC family protein [Ktedonobacterales bacterium]